MRTPASVRPYPMIEAEAIRRVLEVQQHPAVTYTPTPGFADFVEDR